MVDTPMFTLKKFISNSNHMSNSVLFPIFIISNILLQESIYIMSCINLKTALILYIIGEIDYF